MSVIVLGEWWPRWSEVHHPHPTPKSTPPEQIHPESPIPMVMAIMKHMLSLHIILSLFFSFDIRETTFEVYLASERGLWFGYTLERKGGQVGRLHYTHFSKKKGWEGNVFSIDMDIGTMIKKKKLVKILWNVIQALHTMYLHVVWNVICLDPSLLVLSLTSDTAG